MIVTAFAVVGVESVVHEVTGYQVVREHNALQAMLDRYLRSELAVWAKTFPDEFYKQIFRLRGWEWKGRAVNPPGVVAHYTKDLIYARLAPGLLKELELRLPKGKRGPKARCFCLLTEDVGMPALAQHMYAVIVTMRQSDDWPSFMAKMDRALPRHGDTLLLPLMSSDVQVIPVEDLEK